MNMVFIDCWRNGGGKWRRWRRFFWWLLKVEEEDDEWSRWWLMKILKLMNESLLKIKRVECEEYGDLMNWWSEEDWMWILEKKIVKWCMNLKFGSDVVELWLKIEGDCKCCWRLEAKLVEKLVNEWRWRILDSEVWSFLKD